MGLGAAASFTWHVDWFLTSFSSEQGCDVPAGL